MDLNVCSKCGEYLLPQWIVCPLCAFPASSEDQEMSCPDCRGSITPESQTCPHCHVPIVRRYCPGCSRLVPDQTNFCPYCQTPAYVKRRAFKTYLKVAVFLAPILFAPKLVQFYLDHQTIEHNQIVTNTRQPVKPAAHQALKISTEQTSTQQAGTPDAPESSASNSVEALLTSNVPQDWMSWGSRLKEGRRLSALGSDLMKQGRYQEAIPILQSAVDTFPTDTSDLSYGESLYQLGNALRRNGQPERAIPVLKSAMRFAWIQNKVTRELRMASYEMAHVRAASNE